MLSNFDTIKKGINYFIELIIKFYSRKIQIKNNNNMNCGHNVIVSVFRF